jgi:hypothetical protein
MEEGVVEEEVFIASVTLAAFTASDLSAPILLLE